ncbi:hypothetical protein [Actinokineospora sp.]|uniref:hypothetical protein n=1 Tax=Actinokineospora sp. TaxID=1872133 RepID=UPI004038061E
MTVVRAALPGDFDRLRAIEVDAGAAFQAVGMDFIADLPAPPDSVLRRYADGGRCWVADEHAARAAGNALTR